MPVRRSASLAVAAIGFVTLAACSSSSSSSASSALSASPRSAASSPAKLKSIFFANPLPAYPDWATANKCFESETTKLGIKGVTPLFQRAKSQGMEIATLNTGTATKDQDLEVGTDYGTQGAKVAANIGKRPGQQNVGIITNQPGGIGDVIINAFKSHLPANVKVVATAFDSGDPSKTVDVAEQLLTAHPETNILFSWEGTAVAGITTAIKEKGKVGHVFGVVNDLTPQVVDGIRGGTIYGTSRQHFCDMAKKAVDLLVAVSQGKQVPPTTDTGTTFVTKGNLDAVLAEATNES